MSRARGQAQAIKCLSNLRQIGNGFQLYAHDYRGMLVPGWIDDAGTASAGMENYATLLIALKYVPAPTQTSFQNDESAGDSVFRCPAGLDLKHELPASEPTGQTDGRNSMFWRRKSTLLNSGVMADSWYGLNGVEQGNGANAANHLLKQAPWPMRRLVYRPNGTIVGQTTKLAQLRRGAELALLFDGVRMHNGNSGRISARHGRRDLTNVLFADGHVDGRPTATLPRLTEAQWIGSDPHVFDPFAGVRWRLDQ